MQALQRLIVTFLVATLSLSAHAVDTFDLATNRMTIPSLILGTTEYKNVTATLGGISVVSVGTTLPLASNGDTFDTTTLILTIPYLKVGGTQYSNVQLRMNSIVVESIGDFAPTFELPPMPGS